MMNPPTIKETVFAALVSAFNRLSCNFPGFDRRLARADAAELRALPALDEHGLTPRFEWTLADGDSRFRLLPLPPDPRSLLRIAKCSVVRAGDDKSNSQLSS